MLDRSSLYCRCPSLQSSEHGAGWVLPEVIPLLDGVVNCELRCKWRRRKPSSLKRVGAIEQSSSRVVRSLRCRDSLFY